jgi:hypothetical protein
MSSSRFSEFLGVVHAVKSLFTFVSRGFTQHAFNSYQHQRKSYSCNRSKNPVHFILPALSEARGYWDISRLSF